MQEEPTIEEVKEDRTGDKFEEEKKKNMAAPMVKAFLQWDVEFSFCMVAYWS